MAAHVNVEPDLLLVERGVSRSVRRAVAESPAAAALPWRTFWLLVALPVAIVAAMIARFGVDTPHYDQWIGQSFLYEKLAAGTLGVGDFFVQHNEHRLPVPKLALLLAGVITDWNTKTEMALTLLVLTAVLANYWRVLRATGWRDSPRTRAVFFTMAVFAFSLAQYQNFLWGFQLHFVSSIAFLTACCWVATDLRAPASFVGTILLASAATFSIASGFVCWLLAIPLLLLPRGTVRWRGLEKWWALYGLSFAANLALYFIGYRKPERHPAIDTALQRPLDALQYFATYVGSPFGLGTAFDAAQAAMWIGVALLCGLGVAVVELWRLRRESAVLGRALPWLVICAYGLANAAITSIGRLGFGTEQALESRYCTYALLVPIGLLPLACVLVEHRRRRRAIVRALGLPVLAALASVLLTLSMLSSVQSVAACRIHQRSFRMEKALVQTVHWISEPTLLESNVTPEVAAIRGTVRALDRLGYLRPAVWKSAAISEAGDPADPGGRAFGQIEGMLHASGALVLRGWAVLPERRRAADAVLLTCDDAHGMPRLVDLAPTTLDRPDIEQASGTRDYFGCGWAAQWPASRIPAAASLIKAWAYDAEVRRAYRLEGAFTVVR